MCIHMDNFLYGVLQSIADYGIEDVEDFMSKQ